MNLAQGQETILLYPNKIPNSKPTTNKEKLEVRDNGMEIISEISIPSLAVYIPAKPSSMRTAVIICPGGGYQINAMKHEGTDVAKKFNEWGITAFVLKYRIPNEETMVDKSIGPLQDAQQSILFVRENASKWNIDPNKIGLMGFSAGGHLAATAATHFKRPVIANTKNTSLRPDFLVLGYPVISFTDTIGHVGSRNNLLGKNPSSEKILDYSNEYQVTSETPMTFIVHAGDDKAVLPANSLAFYESLLKNNVPAELHLYEKGGHGFGLNNPTTDDQWIERFKNWMATKALLERGKEKTAK